MYDYSPTLVHVGQRRIDAQEDNEKMYNSSLLTQNIVKKYLFKRFMMFSIFAFCRFCSVGTLKTHTILFPKFFINILGIEFNIFFVSFLNKEGQLITFLLHYKICLYSILSLINFIFQRASQVASVSVSLQFSENRFESKTIN